MSDTFEWDWSNLRKIRAHRIKVGELRFVYYGEANSGRTAARLCPETLGGTVKVGAGRTPEMPKFKSESIEADWWASRAGREYVKHKSAAAKTAGTATKGAALVQRLNRHRSVQIAIRLPAIDIEQARKIAGRKGIGYQTLVKMLVHEGLAREARRA